MDVRTSVFWIIVGTGVVTAVSRVLPLVLLSRITLPEWMTHWLGYVTIAILAALLTQSVILSEGHIALFPNNLAVLAVIPTLLVAIKIRNLIMTVVGGVITMALLRLLMG